jgi:hypothetical protein
VSFTSTGIAVIVVRLPKRSTTMVSHTASGGSGERETSGNLRGPLLHLQLREPQLSSPIVYQLSQDCPSRATEAQPSFASRRQ